MRISDWSSDVCSSDLTGQNLDLIGFLALRDEFRRARLAAIEIRLDVGFRQRQPRRTAIDHAADRRTMAFTKAGHAEQLAECVSAHFICSTRDRKSTRLNSSH